jgi:hypothetical protein
MRRRIQEEPLPEIEPPADLVNYEVWCAQCGLVPFSVAGTPANEVALAQYREHMRERQEWADAHGVDREEEIDVEGAACRCRSRT